MTSNVKFCYIIVLFFWLSYRILFRQDSPRPGVTTSSLSIRRVDPLRHSGLFSCAPSNSAARTVRVHVLEGENPSQPIAENV